LVITKGDASGVPTKDDFNVLMTRISNKMPLVFGIHVFCFISDTVKKQPVDTFENFEGVS